MFSFYQINSFQIMTKIFSFQLKFFLLERIFGDIFLHNYLDFLETNPIVQYLKFDSQTLYDYSKIRFFFFSLQFPRSRQMSEVHHQSLCQCGSHDCEGKLGTDCPIVLQRFTELREILFYF